MPLILDPNPDLPSQSVTLFTATHHVRGPGSGSVDKVPAVLPSRSVPRSHIEAQYSLEHQQSQHCGGRQAGPRPWWPASWVSRWALGSVKDVPQNRMKHSRGKFLTLTSGLLTCTHRRANLYTHCVLTQRQKRSNLYQVIFLGSWIYLIWVYCSDFQTQQYYIKRV